MRLYLVIYGKSWIPVGGQENWVVVSGGDCVVSGGDCVVSGGDCVVGASVPESVVPGFDEVLGASVVLGFEGVLGSSVVTIGKSVVDTSGEVGGVCVGLLVVLLPGGGRVPPLHSGTLKSKSHALILGLKYKPPGHSCAQ